MSLSACLDIFRLIALRRGAGMSGSGSGRRLLCGAICLLLLLLLLAGCGGPSARKQTPGKPGSVVQKHDGAYYKDDGPADEIPGGLDGIPDAVPRPEPLHRFANRPYVVLGKSYVPNTRLKPLRQRGVASWYGRKFHGQRTSIGEPYDMFAMTAAHPTLALPSYARVTHLGNGKSVVVRVIDRGPFHAGRIIDLSYAAAHRLGYINDGSAQVEVRALLPGETDPPEPPVPPEPPAPPEPPPQAEAQAPLPPAKSPEPRPRDDELERLMTQLAQQAQQAQEDGKPAETTEAASAADAPRGVFLQLGAFSSADNAESLRARLARDLDWLAESIQIQAGDGVHRVQLGPYARRADAESVAETIREALGYRPGFVTR